MSASTNSQRLASAAAARAEHGRRARRAPCASRSRGRARARSDLEDSRPEDGAPGVGHARRPRPRYASTRAVPAGGRLPRRESKRYPCAASSAGRRRSAGRPRPGRDRLRGPRQVHRGRRRRAVVARAVDHDLVAEAGGPEERRAVHQLAQQRGALLAGRGRDQVGRPVGAGGRAPRTCPPRARRRGCRRRRGWSRRAGSGCGGRSGTRRWWPGWPWPRPAAGSRRSSARRRGRAGRPRPPSRRRARRSGASTARPARGPAPPPREDRPALVRRRRRGATAPDRPRPGRAGRGTPRAGSG